MRAYHELKAFAGYELEDSYVLEIVATPGLVRVECDLKLLPDHPSHERFMVPGAYAAYARGVLLFRDVTALTWAEQGLRPAIGAGGEIDYGSVDGFRIGDGEFELDGDWGRMRIVAREIVIELAPLPAG